jgi:hypothetical protein
MEAVAISRDIIARTKTHTDIPATFRWSARESEAARQAVLEANRAHWQFQHPASNTPFETEYRLTMDHGTGEFEQ